uniref:Abnormal cell migration protein 18-like fibronectin type I domain-containing protein n=2 Tax=Caenorhabditis japonica TaxID=281687 RepID=A0A8R1HHH9_CAEJA
MTLFLSLCLLFLYTALSIFSSANAQCEDNGVSYTNGDKWIRNNHFLVTCRSGNIQTIKCVTDSGHLLDVGSKSHMEHGYEYTCQHDQSTEQLNTNACPTFADFSDDIFKDRFAICCISRRFKGCVDVNGDIVKQGFFVIGNKSLKFCRIQKDQLGARIEPKGTGVVI